MAHNYYNQRAVIRIYKESDEPRIDDYVVAFPFDGCNPDAIPCFNTMEGCFECSWEELRKKTHPAGQWQEGEVLADISRFGYFVKVEDRLPSYAWMKGREGVTDSVNDRAKNFKQLLERHFSLSDDLLADVDPNEDGEPKDDFTSEGWLAWGRYIDLVKDMESLGLLDARAADLAIEKVWDIVYDD